MFANNYKDMLYDYLGYDGKSACSEDENARLSAIVSSGADLPPEYVSDKDYPGKVFYKLQKFDLSPEEIRDLVSIKKARDIRTIKKCSIFFSVSLACQLISILIFLIISLVPVAK